MPEAPHLSIGMEPPTGVKLIAGYLGFAGAILLAIGLILEWLGLKVSSGFGALFSVFGILAVAYLAVAYGLWNLQAWAWWIAEFLCLTSILSSLSLTRLGMEIQGASVAINIIVAAYLYSKRRLFGVSL